MGDRKIGNARAPLVTVGGKAGLKTASGKGGLILPGPKASLFAAIGNGGAFDFSGNAGLLAALGSAQELAAAGEAIKYRLGPLYIPGRLEGIIAAVSALTGNVAVARGLVAALASSSDLSGALTRLVPYVGALASVSALTGDVSVMRALVAALASESSLSGALSMARPLVGSLASTSDLSGSLAFVIPLEASLASASSLAADLVIARGLVASLASVSSASANVSVARALVGSLASVSSLSGDLSHTNLLLWDAITALGLTTNCKLCLDARDSSSYSGSGQSWTDRSGVSSAFYRGTGSGSDAADPTFNGAAGSLGAYWSFDGGDYFTYSAANPTWVNAIHKTGGVCTWLAWAYLASTGSVGYCGDGTSTSDVGFFWGRNSSDKQQFAVFNGSATHKSAVTSASVPTSAWELLSVVYDHDASTITTGWNTTFETPSVSSSGSASSSDASDTLAIGARKASGNNPLSSGSRIAAIAALQGVALTQSQITAIFGLTRGGFGV